MREGGFYALSDGNGVLVEDYVQRKAPFVLRVEDLALRNTKTGDS